MSKAGKPYQKLLVWQRAHSFARSIYVVLKSFPREEQFALTSQIRRAAVSVPANIVEGYAKQSKRDYCRFLLISQGSLSECEYYLELAKDLGYITEEVYLKLDIERGEVGFLLGRLIRSLKDSS